MAEAFKFAPCGVWVIDWSWFMPHRRPFKPLQQLALRALRPVTLRAKLLRDVLLPLALVWALGAVLVVGSAYYFAAQAYDRSLVDDAEALAAQVVLGERGELRLLLSANELTAVLFDQSEMVYFALYREDGSFVAGHKGLYLDPPSAAQTLLAQSKRWHLGNTVYQNRDLRAVSLRKAQPSPYVLVLAQTNTSREALLRNLLFFSLIPQLLVLLGLSAWLRRRIDADLQPLADLRHAIEQRDATDLSPVPPALAMQAKTRDVQSLGGAMNALFKRLQSSLQNQREFAGTVAHELRTPLAGIRAQAELGLLRADLNAAAAPSNARHHLEKILQSEGRASHLIEQLLALAFADEVKATLTMSRVNMQCLVQEAALRFMPQADRAGVDLGVDMPEPRAGAFGDADADAMNAWGQAALIEAALDNLLDNALRYGQAPLGQGRSRVTLRLRRSGGLGASNGGAESEKMVLTVEDNGCGLDAEQVAQAIARWKHERSQDAFSKTLGQGAGLGLAIVTRYAQLLKADLQFSIGEGGVGLRASLYLPLDSPQPVSV
jgi:two-component system, OmpR family, sensor histidine kinase TctE